MPLDFKEYCIISLPSVEFGLELELDSPERAFAYYEPVAGLVLEGASSREKAASLLAYCRSLSHGDKRVVLEKVRGPAFLPPTLHRDDTGNVELKTDPYGSWEKLEDEARWFLEHLGPGSLQAMVSLPFEQFFPNEESHREHLGWLNFFNELDILERLERGRIRWEENPGRDPLRSFLHPYLGPMIQLRHRLLAKFLRENAAGRMFDPENILRPARRDQSFKFVGSTAYRPDVAGPSRIAFEIRDAHKDWDLLRLRVARVLHYWKGGQAFARFADLPPFDSEQAFLVLPEESREQLMSLCPNRAPPEVLAFEKPRFTYEVFRNFAYPLRDWNPWLEILGERAPVEAAQALYRERLASALKEKNLRKAQAALSLFARESGLYALFRREEERLA